MSDNSSGGFFRSSFRGLLSWFDNSRSDEASTAVVENDGVDLWRVIPFIAMHLVCLTVFIVGYSHTALLVAVLAFLVRMFAITAFYHRYFSHRTFKTSRLAQFVFAFIGAAAVQRGPIWWAAHHRNHHAHSDQPDDAHSPVQHGFWRAHMGWFLINKGFAPDLRKVRDLTQFPELRWLDRFDIAVPVLFAVAIFFLGVLLSHQAPELGTNGWQMLVWGFFISTIACSHVTYSINSLAHVIGKRRYITHDASRNNWFLALFTLGEGWHNNHHYCPNSVRQGFYWWEIDISYYVLKVMSWLGIVWDLQTVPIAVRDSTARRVRK
jgi:stearoyl-CoA desaturase (Delta-9 desaturase)